MRQLLMMRAGANTILAFLLSLAALNTTAGTFAQFRTPLGDIQVELYDQDKPATVANFIAYVQKGLYKDMIIHRWVPDFVIQGGGWFVDKRNTTNAIVDQVPRLTFTVTNVQGTITTNVVTLTNEYSVGRTFSNTYGTIAMARVGGQTNSATSEWFFNLANNSGLDTVDGGFTVFGHVVSGTNLLNRFTLVVATNGVNGIYLLDLGSPLDELPVLSASATINDLVFVDVTLLNVKVSQTNSTRTISWNSVSNKVNRVEYTIGFPPTWQTLATTNGTGLSMNLTDTNTASAQRFYRVRVDY